MSGEIITSHYFCDYELKEEKVNNFVSVPQRHHKRLRKTPQIKSCEVCVQQSHPEDSTF